MTKTAVLIVGWPIEPECDAILREMERMREFDIFRLHGMPTDEARSVLASDVLDLGYQDLIWVEPDVSFTVDQVRALRARQKGFIAAIHAAGIAGGINVEADGDVELDGEPHEVTYASLGLAYTNRSVYDAMQLPRCRLRGKWVRPYFMPMTASMGGELVYLPSDHAFCLRAIQHGIKLFADTSVRVRRFDRTLTEVQDSKRGFVNHGIPVQSPWGGRVDLPGIHVLIPMLNQADGIHRSVNSLSHVLSGLRWRLTILDGGSTDASVSEAATIKHSASASILKRGEFRNTGQGREKLIPIAKEWAKEYPMCIFATADGKTYPPLRKLMEEAVQGDITQLKSQSESDWNYAVMHADTLTPGMFAKSSEVHDEATDGVRETSVGACSWRNKLDHESLQRRSDQITLGKSAPWSTLEPILEDGQYQPTAIEDQSGLLIAYRQHDSAGNDTIHIRRGYNGTSERCRIVRMFEGSRFEDPRLFRFRGGTYCSYTEAVIKHDSPGSTVLFREMTMTAFGLMLGPSHAIDFGQNLNPTGWEKNWQFFESGGQLHFIYDAATVCEVIDREGRFSVGNIYEIRGLRWDYGDIRGGTPPIPYDDKHLITFFHSSVARPWGRLYFAGAYVFEKDAPFRVTQITAQPLLAGNICDRSAAGAVVFPCGALRVDGGWKVFYGHNDLSSRVATFTDTDLNKSLTPI